MINQFWHCPRCDAAARTVDTKVPHHPCSGLGGLLVPLIVDGTNAKIEVVEREDYIGTEDVQYDVDGRPVMSVVVTRDEGQDVTVYAPCANGRGADG